VSPLVAHRILALDAAALPGELRQGLREHVQDNVQRNVTLTHALLELLDAFRASGVDALPFKGQTLGALAYDDFALRRAGDIDVLVRKQQLPGVWAVLERLGYREGTEYEIGRPMTATEHAGYLAYQCEYLFLRPKDGVAVEPHWAVAPPALSIRLPYEDFWRRASTVPLQGRDVATFSVPDLFVVACVHASKHEWTRLQWICDVAGLLARHPEADVDAALGVARAHGVERMVLMGLGLVQRIYGAALPSGALQRLKADAVALRLTGALAGRLFEASRETSTLWRANRLRMRMRERWRDRAVYVFRTVVTPTEKHYRLVDLPPSMRFLYLPVKLVHDYLAWPAWQIRNRAARLLAAGRRHGGTADAVLVVDWVPHLREGAGSPRLNGILRLLVDAGCRVTLHPVEPCLEPDAVLYADIPESVEIVRGRGIDDVEAFLEERGHDFGTIIVGRPMNMFTLRPVFERRPELRGRVRLVYDSEALSATRTIAQRQLLGQPLSPDEASLLIAQEVGLAAGVDAVLAVSRTEQALFREYGAPNVVLVGYPAEPAPTPRGFAEREGLLFVGRVAEDGWPNADSLVWYRDHVLPRLAERGWPLTLTIAGKTGARQLAEHADKRMHFLGVVDDLVPLFDKARVFIAPTRFAAGTAAKLYEAAAHGVPIVATRLLAEQLGWEPGEDLLACEVGDADAFADHIVALYTRPDLWERLRENALRRIARECSPSTILEQLRQAMHTSEEATRR
jgi:glycosyltransferase involved in cell wall biosynthesis